GKPMVLVDRLHKGLDVDFVSLDNHQAIYLSAQHLFDAGYHELLLVTEPLGEVSSRVERARAFDAFVAGHPPVSGRCTESREQDRDALADALRACRDRAQARSTMPAIIANNAVVTLRIVAAVDRLGWELGKDIGLVGIDDTEWAPYVGPGISTVSQPTNELGRKAAICLMQRVSGLNIPARRTLLPGALVVRGSSQP